MRTTASRIALLYSFILLLICTGCGGGGASAGPVSGPGPTPNPQDFGITVQPQSVPVIAGNSGTFTVSVTGVNGFTSAVDVSVGVLPTGITVSPATFSLTPGNQKAVTISASLGTAAGNFSVTVSATSGSLAHTQTLSLQVAQPTVPDHHSPGRTRYLRTDTLNDWGFLSYFPQQNFAVYDSTTKRIFLADPRLNVIIAFDDVTETEIARITVPGAFSLDLSPDHSVLWVGTQVADLYEVDPVALKIKKRIPSIEIGPTGFSAFAPRAMHDGKLALLGAQGGIPFIDGYAEVGVWDPSNNSLKIYTSSYGSAFGSPGQVVCGASGNFGIVQLSSDRSKILLGSAFSDSTFCELDPLSGSYRTVTTPVGFIDTILATPDGKTLIIANQQLASVYDAKTLALKSQFGPGGGIGSATGYFYLLTYDGSGLYVFNKNGADAYLYDYNTWQSKGWIAGLDIKDSAQQDTVSAQVVDETGLVFGEISHGVAFVDTSILHSGKPFSGLNGFVKPSFGPPAGGTQTEIYASFPGDFALGDIFFGNQPALGASMTAGRVYSTTPGGPKGAVDVWAFSSTGSMILLPEAFSYGPQIIEVLPTHTTLEGGAPATIFGYGFGPTNTATVPSDLRVVVGGHTATVTSFSTNEMYSDAASPFPMQQIGFALPAGTAGSAVDITVSNSTGSATVTHALTYTPAIKTFPHPGSVFLQGVYDKYRDVYYFSDVNSVQVFSITQGKWLNPLLTVSSPNSRLFGLSISPDGSKLAITNAGLQEIYLVNMSTNAVKTFTVPVEPGWGETPAALAVADSGMIYYATFYTLVDGGSLLHRLNPDTGAATDYQQVSALAYGADVATRVLLSSDSRRLYVNSGFVAMIDTSSDQLYSNNLVGQGDYELALASNETWMSGTEYMMDTNLNVASYLVVNEREASIADPIYGTKLSPDGKLAFSPEIHAISVFDGQLGTLRARVSLPITLAPTYDALVSNGKDNELVAITGDNADGIAVIDLNSLPEPLPLAYAVPTKSLAGNLRTAPPITPKEQHQRLVLQAQGTLQQEKAIPQTRKRRTMNSLLFSNRKLK